MNSRRGAQDLVYRRFAIATIELYCEAYPEKTSSLKWLLEPSPRHSLLSELGRVGGPRSDMQGVLEWSAPDVNRLIHVALEIADRKPSTKLGVTMIREVRRRNIARP